MQTKSIILTLLGLYLSFALCQESALPRYLGEVQIPFAAYMEPLMDQGDQSIPVVDRFSIYISTFNSLSALPDAKFMIRAPGRNLNNVSMWNIEEIDRNAQWPNNPDIVPGIRHKILRILILLITPTKECFCFFFGCRICFWGRSYRTSLDIWFSCSFKNTGQTPIV